MSAGGIVLPSNSADPQGYGKVISLGEDVENKSLKVGDVITFHIRAGMDMAMEKEIMRTLTYGEVYGKILDESFIKNLSEMTLPGNSEETLIV